MNKVIVCLLVAVALLGMALVMLNQQLTPKPNPGVDQQQNSTAKLPALPELSGDSVSTATVKEDKKPHNLPPLPDTLDTPEAIHRAPVTDNTPSSVDAPAALDTPKKSGESEPVSNISTEKDGQTGKDNVEASDAPQLQPQTAQLQKRASDSQINEQKNSASDTDETTSAVEKDKNGHKVQPLPSGKLPTTATELRADRGPHNQTASKPSPQPVGKPIRGNTQENNKKSVAQSSSRNSGIKSSQLIIYTRDGGVTVRFLSGDVIDFKHLVLTQPDRVVVDLQGKWDVKPAGLPKNNIISNVRFGKFPDRTRVVIDLHSAPTKTAFSLSQNHRQLDVRVDR